MLNKLKNFILPEDNRGRKIGKNVIWLGFLQGISILTSFLLVPLTIGYISASQYGIWLTVSSIVGWFALIDIGLGAGLRNRLTEALAKDNILLAKKYVSTTYISLGIFVLVFFVTFLLFNPYINWSVLLNQPPDMNEMLAQTMFIVFSFFAVRLVVQLIGVILTAHMLPAVSTAISTMSNILVLLVIWILSKYVEGSLFALALVMSAIPAVAYILVSVILFSGRYRTIAPSVKYFEKSKIKNLMGLGIAFFFIKISMILLFQTSNILIIQLFTNDDVVVYNLAFKLFSLIFILFEILIQPFWTGYTDAWVKKDVVWIEKTIKRLFKIWKLLTVCALLLLAVSCWVYKLWIGSNVNVPFILSATLCLYFILRCYGGTFNIFINGTGKIRLQTYALGVVVLAYVPIVLLFAKVLNMGLISIPLALIISDFYSLFIARIQYKKLIKGTATGIWNK